MTGLVRLVPLAELLASATGSRGGATELAVDVFRNGTAALGQGSDDIYATVRHQITCVGIINSAGTVVTARAAELILVCEILAACSLPTPDLPPDARLVFSAPDDSIILDDIERLDGLILDVIRLASDTLQMGGAFWNQAGFDILEEVLVPALGSRNVALTIYANNPDREHRSAFVRRLNALRGIGDVTIRWFTGTQPKMLHAKFVIGDRTHGYLGTANLTSWGMHGHIEAGVELTATQSQRFLGFLEQLDEAGLFAARPPNE